MLRDAATDERTISKGTIRFLLSEPVPVKLIERTARFRVQEALAREKANISKG
jgi:uncharacterized protein YdhG (YjbR/CyaY superfamily)